MFAEGNIAPVRRNPLITRTLYYSNDMESFATGLKRIHDLCEAADVKVEYECGSYFFTVRFYRHGGTQSGTQSVQERIVGLIESNHKITRAEMSKELGISVRKLQRVLTYECPTLQWQSIENTVLDVEEFIEACS